MLRITLASAVAAATLLAAPAALAQQTQTKTAYVSPSYSSEGNAAADPVGWSAQALLGFAFNDIGFGIGARAGYTLDSHFYVGGTLMYDFGNDGVSAFLLGAEGGYDFPVGPVIIRPYLGLGVGIVAVSIPTVTVGGVTPGGGSASNTDVAIWPGCTVLYPIPGNERWFVGGDARVLIINDFNTFALFALGGLRF